MDRRKLFERLKAVLGTPKGAALSSAIGVVVFAALGWKFFLSHPNTTAKASHSAHQATAQAHLKVDQEADLEEKDPVVAEVDEKFSDTAENTDTKKTQSETVAKTAVKSTEETELNSEENMPLEAETEYAEHLEVAKVIQDLAEKRAPKVQGPWYSQLWITYRDAFDSVQNKARELVQLEVENHRLALENANLRKQAESLQFSCEAKRSEQSTQHSALRLKAETGAEMGRTLASVHYTPPSNLLPKQLFTLAVSYFKTREDEKAAVIFTYLTGMEDPNPFKAARYQLLAGIAWYRMDHFKEAEAYFDRVIKAKVVKTELPYQAQARLWKALVSQRRHETAQVQLRLRDLLDHHPRAPEAAWVNPVDEARKPASQEAEVRIIEENEGKQASTHHR